MQLLTRRPSQSVYVETGQLIRETRKAQAITQGRLAEKVGLSRTSITNIEQGRQKLLLHTLAAIADALGVQLHRLLPKPNNMKLPLEQTLPEKASPKVQK